MNGHAIGLTGDTTITDWLQLIRAEYAEVPGLKLTKAQVQDLWRLDPWVCDVLLNALVDAEFLRRVTGDAYVRAGNVPFVRRGGKKLDAPHGAAPAFNTQTFLESAGGPKTTARYRRGAAIFTQGDACEHVMYIQAGGVKLSVLSKTGREAVVAVLGPGDFFGEGCLAGQPLRVGSASAITLTTILIVAKARMVGLLHRQHAVSDRFIAYMLTRNIRIEEDLIDQLFNSCEKRLARALLVQAGYGKQDRPARAVPKISQETLAKMIGTTRSRVSFFLTKFKKLGFIEYSGERPIKINSSLLRVMLHD